jgi:hypothetical protein
MLDAELVPVAREAFLDADELPADAEVLQTFSETMQLLGEGYNVIALAEPTRRFVVKYAKQLRPTPPLGSPERASRQDWTREHGVRPDGSLHPAIWQHIRAFEAYGLLVVPSRVYIADTAFDTLSDGERLALERFRSIGIVRSLGTGPRAIRVTYPDDFPDEKRAPEAVTVSVVVAQPFITPLANAIEWSLKAGDVGAARELELRYNEFTQLLWHCGISHLDFSILNIGVVGSGANARLQIFDPHMGVIDPVDGARAVQDPLTEPCQRSLDHVLRSSRDGSRWALWRVQQDVSAAADVPPAGAKEAAALVREFHAESEGIEEGRGSFGSQRFDRKWQQRRTHTINTVMHAQLSALLRHPLGELVRSVLEQGTRDAVYDRALPVRGMNDDDPLAQFCAGLKVFERRPLLLVANVSADTPALVKHWGRVRLPAELDIQDDAAIHYHLHDLFTGEIYVRPGDELARRGLVIGLAPHELHVLQVQDIRVDEMAVERILATNRDISQFLSYCTKRVGVVGDVHGELQALMEILRALGFIDSSAAWCARDGTLVLTGDVGHGRHLQEVFDFIHALAAQAHAAGGRIVWTLGNHDLYVDREGGQGGEDSLGYRLWPTIREAALHPERHPGLTVQAAYFEHGKVFVHAGILPSIVALARDARGAADAQTVASYVNDVLRRTLVERERISARDLPHEIFHIGTSHTRERRMPGEIGYEPAGVFTPDLRELDHYRYHDHLLPQVVGHTASRRGEIRYSPGSWRTRDYIAIDVGRQHGTGNGGLLLTDFGWVAVNPGGPARLVEVSSLLVTLALEEERSAGRDADVTQLLRAYFSLAQPKQRTIEQVGRDLSANLLPSQVAPLERALNEARASGRCVIVTDIDELLTAFSGRALEEDTIAVVADYLAAGGILVLSTDTGFDWLYARLLKPLIADLGPRSPRLANILLILSGGADIFSFQDGGYARISHTTGRDKAAGLDALLRLSKERSSHGMPLLDSASTTYIADSYAHGSSDRAMAGHAGTVIDVGDARNEVAGEPVLRLHRGYRLTMDIIVAATAAMRESGQTMVAPLLPESGDAVPWTFDRPHFPMGRRLRVRVGGSGFVHAGVTRAGGDWVKVYNVPLVPVPEGDYEAVLPSGVDAFTFFWTEPPWTSGHPGHWERRRSGPSVFTADRT